MKEDNMIILNDENGKDVRFEFLDLVEYQGEEYVILLPAEADDEDGAEVVILKLEGCDGEKEQYVSVDSEEELNAVFAIFKDRNRDVFNFLE